MVAKKPKVKRRCEKCGRFFYAFPYRGKARWCSKKCWSNRSPLRKCNFCSRPFRVISGRTKYCGRSCSARGMVGEHSSNWKGGKSLADERARLMPQRRRWSLSVMIRDKFKCARCGKGGRLHAHHIKPWASFPDLRFDVSNGETLCVKCHGDEHGRDFTTRRNKKCADCGRKTKGRGIGGRCRPCSIKSWHRQRLTSSPRKSRQ